MIRTWIGYDIEKAIIVDVMEYEGDDFDRIPGATYVEIFPPLHPSAIKLEKDNGNISVVRDDDKWALIEPKLLRNFRQERNKRLEQTDRYATLDYPHSNLAVQQTWFDYRQALRDLPSTTEDPANPVWPVRPDEVVPVEETPTEETPTE